MILSASEPLHSRAAVFQRAGDHCDQWHAKHDNNGDPCHKMDSKQKGTFCI